MDNNPIRYSDLIAPDDSIKNAIQQLTDLINAYDAAKGKIQASAQQTAQSIQSVSGATEEQRKTIQATAEVTEQLVQKYKDVNSAEREAIRQRQQLTAAKKEANTVEKLTLQYLSSAEGSYNKLAAEYGLLKTRLNAMSEAERKGTEEGRKMEAQADALYTKMNELQTSTGKYTLQVGNYEIAAKSLRSELMNLTMELAQMRLAGQQGTEAYNELSKKAGMLKDAFMDAQAEIKNMASDTSKLDSIAKGASALQGGMMALTGTMGLMGATSESATKAQRALGYAVSAVSGAMLVQNALQKQSSLMLGVRNIQTWAAVQAERAKAKAIATSTATELTSVVATKAATAAQRVFNLVASANPYVLLAVALTTVVGALVAFALGSNKAAKAQKELLETMEAERTYLESLIETYNHYADIREKRIQREIDLRKSQGASAREIDALERQLHTARMERLEVERETYQKYLDNLDENEKKLRRLQAALKFIKEQQAQGYDYIKIDWDFDGKNETWKIKDLIDNIQKSIDETGQEVRIAYSVQERTEEEQAREKQRQADAAKAAAERGKAAAKAELDAIRAMQDAELALQAEGYERELKQLRLNSARMVEDLQLRLKQEQNLTAKAREAIAAQIISIEKKLVQDEATLRANYALQELATRRTTEDMMLALMDEGAEKQREALRINYTRQINDLQGRLEREKNLTLAQRDELLEQIDLLEKRYAKEREKIDAQAAIEGARMQEQAIDLRLAAIEEGSQEEIDLRLEKIQREREIELAENRLLAEEKRQDEALINAKYDKLIFKTENEMQLKRGKALLEMQQEQAELEFNALGKNERQKTEFALEQQAERIRYILQNDKTLTEEQKKILEGQLADIERQIKRLPYNNIYELLGINLDSDQQEALNTALSQIKDGISSIVDSWKEAAEAAVESADKQVEAAQKVLDAEIEARNNGYANSVVQAQKELELAKKNQQKALKEQEKVQKAQIALDTAQQASSLITATANLWAAFSGVGPWGVALALAAIAGMWISFGAAKLKAWQVAGSGKSEEYGEGTVELLEGGSHASGHDIDLGTKKDGTKRRAEGGEFFAVINKRNSARYKGVIPDVIKAFNDGSFADKYQRANSRMSGMALGVLGGGTDVSGLEKDVRKIREQGEQSQYIEPNGSMVFRYKNLTRKLKS